LVVDDDPNVNDACIADVTGAVISQPDVFVNNIVPVAFHLVLLCSMNTRLAGTPATVNDPEPINVTPAPAPLCTVNDPQFLAVVEKSIVPLYPPGIITSSPVTGTTPSTQLLAVAQAVVPGEVFHVLVAIYYC